MKYILLAVLLGTFICKGQKSNTFNPKEMKTFNIQNFEKNKGRGTIYDHPDMFDYKDREGYLVVQYGTSFTSVGKEKEYIQSVTKETSPIKYQYTYFNNGHLHKEVKEFNNSLLLAKEYDKNGKLIKETDFDKNFKHTFEQIHDMVLKEKKVDIYDTRQAVALRHDTPDANIKKYYQIHVLNSKLVGNEWYSQPDYSFIIDDATGKIIQSAENSQK